MLKEGDKRGRVGVKVKGTDAEGGVQGWLTAG